MTHYPVNEFYIIVTRRATEMFGLAKERICNRVLLHWDRQREAPLTDKNNQEAIFIDDDEISWTVILSDKVGPGGYGRCAFVVGGKLLNRSIPQSA